MQAQGVIIASISLMRGGSRKLYEATPPRGQGRQFVISSRNANLEVGINTAYDIEFNEKPGIGKWAETMTNWVESLHPTGVFPPAVPQPDAPKSTGNGSTLPLDPILRRETSIARQTAEKCAAELTKAAATMLAASGCLSGLNQQQVADWVDEYRKRIYELVIKEIQG